MRRIFIDGGEGTTGLRLRERIAARADCELLTLPEETRKDSKARREMLHAADIAFLCLPDDAAREAVALAEGSRVRIIDSSTAHRTDARFVYGFPELRRYDALKGARCAAVPGCHASGFLALIVPLIEAGILEPSALLSCISITGYSGGGKAMIAEYENTARGAGYAAPRHYALSQGHKHLPEITHVSGLYYAPVFNLVVADFYAGMLVTVPLHAGMLRKRMDVQSFTALYAAYYANRPMISVHMDPPGGFLNANALAGRDSMEIMAAGNEERFSLMARYDNLGKGASGAALQCMNVMLDEDETLGLALA